MPNKRVLVIDEESAFTRFLQDDLEQREISVACVYSPGDGNGAMAFAPNAVVADKNILTNEATGLMQTFDKIERKLPLVLMTGTDTQLTHGSAAPVQASDAQICAPSLSVPLWSSALPPSDGSHAIWRQRRLRGRHK